MNEILAGLEPKEWLDLNAKLQAKKNILRQALKKKGVLEKGAYNKFDNYKYFSEAQYKELFTELLSDSKLELKFTELDYIRYELTGKQPFGRLPKLEFKLIDVETGFYEKTVITGEGIDKGDKAGYKAYTGALKYYLANTFLVATGDENESDKTQEVSSPQQAATKETKEKKPTKATEKQLELVKSLVAADQIPAMLNHYGIAKVEDLTVQQASDAISRMKGAKQ